MQNRFKLIITCLIFCTAGFVAGFLIRGIFLPSEIQTINTKSSIPLDDVDFGPFWETWNIIEEKYYKSTDRQQMLWGSIQGMVESLGDPYSVFFPPKEKEDFDIEITGVFEGVGMEIGIRNDILTVVSPIKGTPAYRAGVKAGDKILNINDESTVEMTVDVAVRKIRGPRGSEVKLTILRNGEEPRDISIIRDVINIPTLETEQKENGVFVISLYNFSQQAPMAFRNALREFINSGSNKLIIDLRNNPGGFLEASVDMASWFLSVGKIVTTEDFSGDQESIVYRSKGYDVFDRLPIVILVNKGSASASEIFSGALRDYGIAKLVGEQTFGKGTVQELISITSDTALKLTVAQWLTPNNHPLEGGLKPDIEVKISEEDEEAGRDTQMEKAIEIILEVAKNRN